MPENVQPLITLRRRSSGHLPSSWAPTLSHNPAEDLKQPLGTPVLVLYLVAKIVVRRLLQIRQLADEPALLLSQHVLAEFFATVTETSVPELHATTTSRQPANAFVM